MNVMKKVWKSPVTSVQEFAPQEYCANCWHVEASDIYVRENYWGFWTNGLFYDRNGDGDLDRNEEIVTNTDRPRLPQSGSFQNIAYPSNLASTGVYYTRVGNLSGDYSNQTYNVYKYGSYYFREYKIDNNHS